LIGAPGTRLLREKRVWEDPAGAHATRSSPTARGKRVPGVEINGPYSKGYQHTVKDFVA
jgi:hypothetical protein